MKMKKLAAFALLLPLSTISLAAFAGDDEQADEKKEGQWVTNLEWTLAHNDNQTEDQEEADQPESSEFTLSENDSTEETEESSTEEKHG
ncbi:hypothetical protein NX722_05320 [Endozoicomonas gorgoniicola]|uniref:Secreted protein n=1 Tax=Endozoicomonas gorgoniicola TaxID=1234144 RepID=A0ABT3MRV9_9GAMM|nr:hypothetical protein [Endozoicomonas gorgoniicola]MCW7552072.1 hypothetical protein [Endozoicomonas gorgoniicola]